MNQSARLQNNISHFGMVQNVRCTNPSFRCTQYFPPTPFTAAIIHLKCTCRSTRRVCWRQFFLTFQLETWMLRQQKPFSQPCFNALFAINTEHIFNRLIIPEPQQLDKPFFANCIYFGLFVCIRLRLRWSRLHPCWVGIRHLTGERGDGWLSGYIRRWWGQGWAVQGRGQVEQTQAFLIDERKWSIVLIVHGCDVAWGTV